jgi:hypothetical protein
VFAQTDWKAVSAMNGTQLKAPKLSMSSNSSSLNNEKQPKERSKQIMDLLSSHPSFLNWPIDILQMVIDYEISAETHIYILGGLSLDRTKVLSQMSVIVIPFDAHAHEYVPPPNIDAKSQRVTIPSPYQTLPNMPHARHLSYACRLDDYVYVIGGHAGSTCLPLTMEQYHIPSQRWLPSLIPLSTSTNDPGASIGLQGLVVIPFVNHAHDDIDPPRPTTTDELIEQKKHTKCLMVIGRSIDGLQCNRYEVTNKWSLLASLSSPNQHFSTVLLNDHVYVFGGEGRPGYYSTCFAYDIRANKWSSIESMSMGRSRTSAAVVGSDTILVMGGLTTDRAGVGVDIIEEYKPSTNKWRTLSWKLPCPCYHTGSIFDKTSRRLIIMAGRSTYIRNQPFDDNEWIQCSPYMCISGFAYCT